MKKKRMRRAVAVGGEGGVAMTTRLQKAAITKYAYELNAMEKQKNFSIFFSCFVLFFYIFLASSILVIGSEYRMKRR